MGRPELADLGRRAAARALDAARTLPGEGLLAGRAGVRLAAYANGIAAGAGPVRPDASDLTDGAAGVLLAHVRTGTAPDGELVRLLARRAVAQEVGWAWADDPGESGPGEQGGPASVEAPRAVPLLGLAHGASGVALALAEAAAIAPDLRPGLALAVGGLAWESGWFDPIQGWPDLRSDEPTFPVWWCHGAAGITTVRLRLLQLAQDDLKAAGVEVMFTQIRFPGNDNGDVYVQVLRTEVSTINSEGLVMHELHDRAVLAVVADTRAADGMHLDAGGVIHLQALPQANDELRKRGEKLVDEVLRELEALAQAPMMEEDYDGPVLFQGPAAAAHPRAWPGSPASARRSPSPRETPGPSPATACAG